MYVFIHTKEHCIPGWFLIIKRIDQYFSFESSYANFRILNVFSMLS